MKDVNRKELTLRDATGITRNLEALSYAVWRQCRTTTGATL